MAVFKKLSRTQVSALPKKQRVQYEKDLAAHNAKVKKAASAGKPAGAATGGGKPPTGGAGSKPQTFLQRMSNAAKPALPYVGGGLALGFPLAKKIYNQFSGGESANPPASKASSGEKALNPDTVSADAKANAKSDTSGGGSGSGSGGGMGSGTGASPAQVKANLAADPNSSGRAYGRTTDGIYRDATGRSKVYQDAGNSKRTNEILKSQTDYFNSIGMPTARQHQQDINTQLADRNSPLYQNIDRSTRGRLTMDRLQNELIDARYAAQVKEKEKQLRAQLEEDGILPRTSPSQVAPTNNGNGGNPSPQPTTSSSTAIGPQDVKYAAGAESAMANGWNGVMAAQAVKQNASDEDVASAMQMYGFNPDGSPANPDGSPANPTSTDASTDSESYELTDEQLDPNHPSYVGDSAAAEYRNYQNNNAVRSQNWLERAQDTAMTVVPFADEGLRVGDSMAKYGLGKTITGRGNVSGLNSGAAKGAMQRTFGVTGKGAGAVANKALFGLGLYEAGADAISELTGKDYSLFSEGKFGEDSGRKGLRSAAFGGNRLAGVGEAVGNNLTAGGYDAVRANMGVLGDLPMPRSWSQAIKGNANAYTAQRGGAVNADPFGSGRMMESGMDAAFGVINNLRNPRKKTQTTQPEEPYNPPY